MGTLVAAFSEEHAARLTGVSVAQLRYWARTDFFPPSFDGDRTVGRVYSFQDIVALRVLHVLRNRFHVSLPHLRLVKERLAHLADHDRWTGTKLWVINKRVVWQEPGTDRPQEIVSGQYCVPVELSAVMDETRRDIDRLIQRAPESAGKVEKTRLVNHNEPVIAGTRIPVRAIKRFSDAGYSVAEIRNEYPDLTEEDIQAALEYGNVRAAA